MENPETYGTAGLSIMYLTDIINRMLPEGAWKRLVPIVPVILAVAFMAAFDPSEGDLASRIVKGVIMGVTLAGANRTVKVVSGKKDEEKK